MRIGRNEIVEELTEHMRKFGGEPGEWCAGVAETDSKFQIQDSRETPSNMPGLAYREAHTAYAAADAVEYLVSAFGLRSAAHQHEHHPALQEQGRIVYVYRPAPAATAAGSEYATFRRLAA
jgi:4-hydroxyphenylpyruvate dioxygenase-like putative hemolysin